MNLSQIFSFYVDEQNSVQQQLERAIDDPTPLTAVDHLGVVHQLWRVTDEVAISQAAALMGDRDLYLADGHHRYETACNYRAELAERRILDDGHPANYVLMTCVASADPGMIVLPTHRLFRGTRVLHSADLAKRLAGYFDLAIVGVGVELARKVWRQIESVGSQSTLGLFTHADQTWHRATLTAEGVQEMKLAAAQRSLDWQSLGVAILHELLVKRLFVAESLPTPRYVHTIKEVVDELTSGDVAGRDATGQMGSNHPFHLAALVLPATLNDIRRVSDRGERMPAKSTYFYPKLLSGLVFNPLE